MGMLRYAFDSLTNLVQAFGSKNVMGTGGSTLSVTGYTLSDGNNGGNYTVVTNTAAGTIGKARSETRRAIGHRRTSCCYP